MAIKAGGYGVITNADGWGAVAEHDTFTCSNCQHVTRVPPKANPDDFGNFCRSCMKMHCKRCAGDVGGLCVPIQKKFAEMEERAYRQRTYGF